MRNGENKINFGCNEKSGGDSKQCKGEFFHGCNKLKGRKNASKKFKLKWTIRCHLSLHVWFPVGSITWEGEILRELKMALNLCSELEIDQEYSCWKTLNE
jgi:hypothetical protein